MSCNFPCEPDHQLLHYHFNAISSGSLLDFPEGCPDTDWILTNMECQLHKNSLLTGRVKSIP